VKRRQKLISLSTARNTYEYGKKIDRALEALNNANETAGIHSYRRRRQRILLAHDSDMVMEEEEEEEEEEKECIWRAGEGVCTMFSRCTRRIFEMKLLTIVIRVCVFLSQFLFFCFSPEPLIDDNRRRRAVSPGRAS